MAKEKSPAYQHYPKDIQSDMNYQMMNWAERGMYRHLMDLCWMEMSIPADPQMICRILQIPFDKSFEQGAWPLVARCFRQNEQDGTTLVHPRLEIERRKQAEWRDKSAAGGRASAHKRKKSKGIHREQGGMLLVPTKGQPKVNQNPTLLSSSPSSVLNKKEREGTRSHFAPADFILSEEDKQWARSIRPDLNIEDETAKFVDHDFRQPKVRWKATWRNWIRNAENYGGCGPLPGNSGTQAGRRRSGGASDTSQPGTKNPRSGPRYDPTKLFD